MVYSPACHPGPQPFAKSWVLNTIQSRRTPSRPQAELTYLGYYTTMGNGPKKSIDQLKSDLAAAKGATKPLATVVTDKSPGVRIRRAQEKFAKLIAS